MVTQGIREKLSSLLGEDGVSAEGEALSGFHGERRPFRDGRPEGVGAW